MGRKRVVVAMSGGVDSSTVAAMLVQDYDVVGITLQLYDINEVGVKRGTCCAGIDIYDAKEVASKLGIPHYVLNYESKFKQSVIEDFADTYIRGETPIPCIKCNQTVKFSDLYKVSKELGADFLATGHYVRKLKSENGSELHKAVDDKKDQSYFLFGTTKEQLDFLEFPLGGFTKEKTRELAQSYGLKVSSKPDSQDICFVPDGNYSKIVEKLRPGALDPGDIKDVDGNVIGRHKGIIGFTIGQRKGLGLSNAEPYYVIKINPDDKSIVVGPEIHLQQSSFYIKNTNWLTDDSSFLDEEVTVKVRSSHQGGAAFIRETDTKGIYKVTLSESQKSITPGQACVVYSGTRVLGGGWITPHN